MKRENVNKFIKNLVLFTAPALVVFFYQLQKGVDFKTAGLIALLALYGVLADFFKKMAEK